MEQPKAECLHLRSDVQGHYPKNKAYCPDCHQFIFISDVFNNFLRELRKALSIQEANQ